MRLGTALGTIAAGGSPAQAVGLTRLLLQKRQEEEKQLQMEWQREEAAKALEKLGISLKVPNVGALVALYRSGAVNANQAVQLMLHIRNAQLNLAAAKVDLKKRNLELRMAERKEALTNIDTYFQPIVQSIGQRLEWLYKDASDLRQDLRLISSGNLGLLAQKPDVMKKLVQKVAQSRDERATEASALVSLLNVVLGARMKALRDYEEDRQFGEEFVQPAYAYALSALEGAVENTRFNGFFFANNGYDKEEQWERGRLRAYYFNKAWREIVGQMFPEVADTVNRLDEVSERMTGTGKESVLPGIEETKELLEKTKDVLPKWTGTGWEGGAPMDVKQVLDKTAYEGFLGKQFEEALRSDNEVVQELKNLTGGP